MRRLAVLGCTLLVVAACGGGGGGGSGVKEMMQTTSPELITTGEYQIIPVDSTGDALTAGFINWGVWGGILRDDVVTCQAIGCPPAGDEFFWAYLNSEHDGTIGRPVLGLPSGTSPVSGSAVWSGAVHAYETGEVMTLEGTAVTTYAPVEGDARLEVDFAAVTVDVDFTNFDNNQADMSWSGLDLDNGTFGDASASIDGSFYGADHEGAAGTFERDDLTGVFGALRSSE